jgi:hypothetical protein
MQMSTTSCPCCGRAFPKPKAVTAVVNPAELSDADVFAYYKRTAPVEDVRFRLRLALAADVRQGFETLLATLESQGGKATPATKREYIRLDQMWRQTAFCREADISVAA